MIYLITVLIILFAVYRYDYCKQEKGKMVFWIGLCLLFICIAGFRYRLGQDTLNYIKDFESLKPITSLKLGDFKSSRFAPGFVILSSIFKSFTSEFTVFQFFHALVINGVVFYFFYKNSKHIFFAALLYFFYLYFLLSFQQMRESFAVAIFLLAWPAFRDGKWITWYIAAFIAFLFHISSFVMFVLPIICLPGIRQLFIFGRRTVILVFLVGLGAIIIQSMFFKYIELIAITETMVERAQTYDKNVLGGSLLNFNGIMAHLFQYVLYPLIALYFIKKEIVQKREKMGFNKLTAMVIMSIYVSIFSIFVTIMLRYNNYFFPFVIVLLSDWIFSKIYLLGKWMRLQFVYWLLLFVPMVGFQVYGTYFRDINRSGTLKAYMVYYPYSSIFEKSKDEDSEKAITYMLRNM